MKFSRRDILEGINICEPNFVKNLKIIGLTDTRLFSENNLLHIYDHYPNSTYKTELIRKRIKLLLGR